jgi:glutathione peroxidase
MTQTPYDISARRIDGSDEKLDVYSGSVLLVVNVASECGKTPQYEGLETLYHTYSDRRFAVLGFPCNQFGGQEPGSESEILEFCKTVYGVDFPMFAKIDVKGPGQHPLYHLLTEAQPERTMPDGAEPKPGQDIRWNFEKFLIGRDGTVIGRYDPDVLPESAILTTAIEDALARPA